MKVSIIMPSLNVVDYIDECIMSAINQTLDDIEIICVDAGSSDGTFEKIKYYAGKTYRGVKIKCLESPKRSYGYQVNLGLTVAEGKYVAILETDDYVDHSMYEELYGLAEKYDLDFANADFDTVVTLKNGYVKRKTIHIFESNCGLYNMVQDFSENPSIYANDHSIWRGIYRKSFLDENNIQFNESLGAAFQDIGFIEQVQACAKRGYYTDKSFYRYRCDREASSVKSNKGLMYSYTEYKRLIDTPKLWEKIKYKPGFYWRMAHSFRGELCKVLEIENYNLDSEYIKPYLDWFLEHIKNAMDQGLILSKETNKMLYADFVAIVTDYRTFAKNLQLKNNKISKKKLEICVQLKGKKIIIFGAGLRGENYIQFLLNHDIDIEGVSDNNSDLWGKSCYGIKIISPDIAISTYKELGTIRFLIASKYYFEEIKNQLIKNGINVEDIFELPQ